MNGAGRELDFADGILGQDITMQLEKDWPGCARRTAEGGCPHMYFLATPSHLAQFGYDYSGGSDGGCLGAQNRWAQGGGVPSGFLEQPHFVFYPTALRTDGQKNLAFGVWRENIAQQGLLFRFREHNPQSVAGQGHRFLQLRGNTDLGRGCTAGLLRGLERDSPPALGALYGGRSQMRVRATCDDGHD